MIRRLTLFLFTIVAMLTGVNFVCQAQSQSLMTRHVREATLNGQAPFVKKLPATQSLRLDVVLPIRNQSELDNFLRELYDPSSPFYRQFLTVQEFTARFGPSQENYDALVQFAKTHGLSVVGGSRDAMQVQVTGSVATIESAFHVTMNVYQHPTEDRTFYAPDREPTVDLPFQLWHISGLDNFSTPHPLYHHRDLSVKRNATTGSGPSASFLGSDMRAAYYGTGSLTGSGQNIGLLEYYGFDIADVNTYYTNAKQTRTAAVTGISTDGTSLSCLDKSGCDDTEQTIDITQAAGMAPGVTTVYVYVGGSDTAILGAMSSDSPLPLQLSSSWTWTPADPSTDDPYFEKMATQGQSFFQAAGDSGDWTTSTYPSEDAHVICVGGTDLDTSSAAGPWSSETAWVDGGGGYYAKDDILIPSYQQTAGVINSSNKGSTTYRNGPDVSANANFTFYVCADQTTCTANEYGGTSFATPIFAGMIAIINQKQNSTGQGVASSTLYSLAANSSTYASAFHDIASGGNQCTAGSTYCSSAGASEYLATSGYDEATGLGSVDFNNLMNAWTGSSGGGGGGGTSGGSFTLSATNVAVTQGNSGTSTVSVVSVNSYAGTVSFSLTSTSTSLNTYGCYAINNAAVTAGATATATLTIYTSQSACSGVSGAHSFARGSATRAASSRDHQPPLRKSIPISVAALVGILFLGFRKSRKAWSVLSCLVLVAMLGFAAGCGSSSGSTTTSTSTDVAAGSYSLTLVGTDTTTASLTAGTTLTLTVN